MIRIPEKASIPLAFTNTLNVDLSAETVTVKAHSMTTGTAYTLGSGTGAAAGTNFNVTCDFASVPVDARYEVEAVADIAGANPITVCPNPKTEDRFVIYVFSMKSY